MITFTETYSQGTKGNANQQETVPGIGSEIVRKPYLIAIEVQNPTEVQRSIRF